MSPDNLPASLNKPNVRTSVTLTFFVLVFFYSVCSFIVSDMETYSLGNIVNGLLNCFVSVRKYVASLKFKLVSTPKLG